MNETKKKVGLLFLLYVNSGWFCNNLYFRIKNTKFYYFGGSLNISS